MLRLKMPENITLRFEFWTGFGKPEAAITGSILATALAVGIFYTHFSTSEWAILLAVIGVLISLFFTILLVSKVRYNQSIIDHIRILRRYRQEQQTFYFKNEEVLIAYAEPENKTKR